MKIPGDSALPKPSAQVLPQNVKMSRNPTSSPLSSAQSSQATFKTASSQSQPTFKPAQSLPFELLQQVKVYLEESLFTQALRFLQGLISANAAHTKKKTLIPPPDYLAFLTTLTVHPSLTSRASTPEKSSQSNAALKLLWTINRTAGPVNSCLSEAYRFRRYDLGLSRRKPTNGDNDAEDPNKDRLNSKFSDEENLFSLAEDFWAVVGWALNCSCLPGVYATRWSYWAPWLEYMLEVLETDWDLREETDVDGQSLLWQYLKFATGGTARGRRILRAIFADGSPAALKEFQEIFRKELKEPRSEQDKTKKQEEKVAVDVDQEIYGDWMQDEETSSDEDDNAKRDDMLQPRPAKRLRTRTPHRTKKPLFAETDDSDASTQDEKGGSKGLGPPDSINIRLRLLQLLSNFSSGLNQMTPNQDPIFPDPHELYTLFVEFIRPLPLSAFQKIVFRTNTLDEGLRGESRIALCEFLLQRTIASDTKNQGISTFEPMTQERLVTEYLPYTAGKGTIEAQAKVSVLLESLVRLMTTSNNNVLRRSADLIQAVKDGTEKRNAKAEEIRAAPKSRKGHGSDDETAYSVLMESGTRLKFVVDNFVDME